MSALVAIGTVLKENRNGTLKIVFQKSVRQFSFWDRQLLFASSNVKSELPGSIFLKEGKISPAQYETYLADLKRPKASPWALAATLANLSPSDSELFRGHQALAILQSCINLDSAQIDFEPKSHRPATSTPLPFLPLLFALSSSLTPDQMSHSCPAFLPDSVLRCDEKKERTWVSVPMSPEERGLLTVARNSKTVADVYSSSFLKRERVNSLLFTFWLVGLLELESAAESGKKAYENSLSEKDKAHRDQIKTLHDHLATTSYYQWLGVNSSDNADAIRQTALSCIEKLVSPVTQKLFMEEASSIPRHLLSKIKEAEGVLIDSTKRAEYDRFLASGKTGSFIQQSVVIRVQEYRARAEKLVLEGKRDEVLHLYERATQEIPDSAWLAAEYAHWVLQLKGVENTTARDLALSELKRVLSFTPPTALVYEVLGEWALAMNQKEKALSAFQKALEISPYSHRAHQGLEKLDTTQVNRWVMEALYKSLGRLDFYQLIQVERQANLSEIQRAYRELTKRFHPDRFFATDNEQTRHCAKEVYKRVVEAYMTLKTPSKRQDYDEKTSRDAVERNTTPPVAAQAKRFLEIALRAIGEGKKETAMLNLKLSLQSEPDNLYLLNKLKEIEST